MPTVKLKGLHGCHSVSDLQIPNPIMRFNPNDNINNIDIIN